MSLVKGDRVEIVVELGGRETRTYEIVATRAGRRVETTTGRGIVEVTEVRVIPATDVDVQFARDEGEGFESVQDWHEAHERFFERTIAADTLIDAIRFRVVERL